MNLVKNKDLNGDAAPVSFLKPGTNDASGLYFMMTRVSPAKNAAPAVCRCRGTLENVIQSQTDVIPPTEKQRITFVCADTKFVSVVCNLHCDPIQKLRDTRVHLFTQWPPRTAVQWQTLSLVIELIMVL